MCTENTVQGECQEANTAQGKAKCCSCLEELPSFQVLYFSQA